MDDLFPGIEFGGTEDIFSALHEAELLKGQDLPIPRHRFSMEDALGFTTVQERSRLKVLSKIIPDGPPFKKRQVLNMIEDFVALHQRSDGLGEGRYVGREASKEEFVDRLYDYLNIRVLRSRQLDKAGNPKLDARGRFTYMAYSTLHSICAIASAVLKLLPRPALQPAELLEGLRGLKKFCKTLKTRYNLSHRVRERNVLRPIDVRGLIETAFSEHSTRPINLDIAVQDSALLLAFMYTGARPGGLLKTDHYPDAYARWKHVVWIPQRDEENITVGFEVRFTIVSFKGYHDRSDLRITYSVPPTTSAKYSTLDFGILSLAHGLRQGVFGSRDLDDLLSSDLAEITCDAAYREEPIFMAKQSRSNLSDRPLDSWRATKSLQTYMRRYGIATGKRGQDTFYLTRRGFGTASAKNLRREHAKFLMGHGGNSVILEAAYDQSFRELNLTETLLEEGTGSEVVINPLSYSRTAMHPVRMSVKDTLARQPLFVHLLGKRRLLQKCLRSSSSAWLDIEPWLSANQKIKLSNAHLPVLIARYTYQLKHIASLQHSQDLSDAFDARNTAVAQIDYETILARKEDAEKPSELFLSLQQKLEEQEQLLFDSEEQPDIPPMTIAAGLDEGPSSEGEDDSGEEDEDDASEEGVSEGEEGQDEGPETNETGHPREDNAHAAAFARGEARFSAMEQLAHRMEADNGQLDTLDRGSVDRASDTLTNLSNEKLQFLRSLVELPAIANKDVCQLCAEDMTASLEEKSRVWKEGVKKQRHIIQFHEAFPTAMRWIKQYVKDGIWTCPFEIDEGSTESGSDNDSDVEMRDLCGKTYSAKTSTLLREGGSTHVVRAHPHAIPAHIRWALDPATRVQARQQVADRLKSEISSTARTVSSVREDYFGVTRDNYLMSGVFDGLDPAIGEGLHDWGLGYTLWNTRHLAFETDEIPDTLLQNGELNYD